MKKQLLCRGVLGFPLGIALGYVITIIISAFWAQGDYVSVTPELLKMMGSEISAVIVQAGLCGLMGSGFAMASLLWEIDRWSIAKQSGVYFAIISAIMLPVAYIANWMEHTLIGFLSYFGIFAGIFLLVWICQYLGWRARVQKLNQGVGKSDGSK